jgi:hypothetical protein
VPLYCFDIIDNGVFRRDDVGMELANLDEAREHAQALLSHMAYSKRPDGDGYVLECEVREQKRKPIYRSTLGYHSSFS